MTDKVQWRAALKAHPVHGIPPLGDPYVLGLWHKDRAHWRGYAFEARVRAKALLVRNTPKKFLMVGRPRSGTSLLRGLLNQVESIHCDGEVLHHAVLNPRGFLNRLAGIKSTPAYGSKILSYQFFEVQMIRDPVVFLERLWDDGYTLVHVRRATFDQTLSLSVAQAGHGYHLKSGAVGDVQEVTVDADRFADQFRHQAAMLDYEDLLFSELPHLSVQYEDDLKGAAAHQATVDRICAALGVPSNPVMAELERISAKRRITNLDTLCSRAQSILQTHRSSS
jgi:hypothetical protein